MTKEEFINFYAEKSGTPVDFLMQYLKAEPCDCGEEFCRGWKMVSLDLKSTESENLK